MIEEQHGHDDESQNGRDIKIDILEGNVWTPERFRIGSGIFRSTGELMGLGGRDEEGRAPSGRPASSSPPLYTGEGAPHRHTS